MTSLSYTFFKRFNEFQVAITVQLLYIKFKFRPPMLPSFSGMLAISEFYARVEGFPIMSQDFKVSS
jgi:hypothetical protein